eukprot:UN24083
MENISFPRGEDSEIAKWDVRTGEKLMQIHTDHTSWVEGIIMTQDGNYVFTSSGDKTIKMWEVN